HGLPGGSTNYYQAIKAQEQGLASPEGLQNLRSVWAQTRSEYGGGEMQALALREIFQNLTLSQIEELRPLIEQGGSEEQITEILRGAKSIEEQTLDVLKEGFAAQAVREAEYGNVNIDQGKSVKAAIEQLQDLMRKLIADIFPAIVKGLQVVADILTSIYDWFSENIGPVLSQVAGYIGSIWSGSEQQVEDQ